MGTAAPSSRVVAAWGRPWQELAHPRAPGDARGPPAPQSFRSAALSSRRELMPSLVNTLRRCHSTVWTDRSSRAGNTSTRVPVRQGRKDPARLCRPALRRRPRRRPAALHASFGSTARWMPPSRRTRSARSAADPAGAGHRGRRRHRRRRSEHNEASCGRRAERPTVIPGSGHYYSRGAAGGADHVPGPLSGRRPRRATPKLHSAGSNCHLWHESAATRLRPGRASGL